MSLLRLLTFHRGPALSGLRESAVAMGGAGAWTDGSEDGLQGPQRRAGRRPALEMVSK